MLGQRANRSLGIKTTYCIWLGLPESSDRAWTLNTEIKHKSFARYNIGFTVLEEMTLQDSSSGKNQYLFSKLNLCFQSCYPLIIRITIPILEKLFCDWKLGLRLHFCLLMKGLLWEFSSSFL